MRVMKGVQVALNRLPLGEYCFASRWGDGSPCDSWCVGFLQEVTFIAEVGGGSVRYKLRGEGGEVFGWFRHCMVISREEGDRILDIYPQLGGASHDISIRKFLGR
jgi:hypothetical protein